MTAEVRVTAQTARLLRVLLEVHNEEQKAKASGTEYHMSTRKLMLRANMPAVEFFPLIARLVDHEWVKEVREKVSPDANRPPRHFYRLTSDGVTRAEKAVEEDDRRPMIWRKLRGKR